MVELELLGANGDTVVMTDANGERYSIIIDDALRAAVRRDRAAVLPQPTPVLTDAPVRPRQLQALMRAGATATEVAVATGMDVAHVRRYEGPVVAERQWAVTQAQSCRIGWEKDSPLLGELVVDRLATRGVNPSSLEWDALREGRDPWLIMVTFIQSAEEKHARWSLDLAARSVHALDDEARWLTEAASTSRRPAVFDQDSQAPGASARRGQEPGRAGVPEAEQPGHAAVPTSPQDPTAPDEVVRHDVGKGIQPAAGPSHFPEPASPGSGSPAGAASAAASLDATDALLADLASNRGRRIEVEVPADELQDTLLSSDQAPEAPRPGDTPEAGTQTSGIRAQVYSMSERRRHGSAGSRLAPAPEPSDPTSQTPAVGVPADSADPDTEPVPEVTAPTRVSSRASRAMDPQASAAQSAASPAPRSRRRSRRSVPSWDEIVFGAKPE
ncbi:septation protein SepH [Actinomyces wuliandei]|uniref:septation protein SepH n=1 Tax=Actinomyces wuliandei TaxID=2057743 RepID=UPI000FDB1E07|nr:septation protein SepH [Actinomyces wuliandei]